jgi:hypothetical protein
VQGRKFNFPNPKKEKQHTLEGVIKPEVSRGVRPIAKTQNFTQGGTTSQSGDGPGRTWRSLDASLNKTIPKAAFEGSGVQRLARESPVEEDGTVLQTQAVTLLQDESYGLHRADTQIVLPCLDVEGRGKMTWTVCLGESHKKVTSSEGLLAVVRAIKKAPFCIRLERGRLTGQC